MVGPQTHKNTIATFSNCIEPQQANFLALPSMQKGQCSLLFCYFEWCIRTRKIYTATKILLYFWKLKNSKQGTKLEKKLWKEITFWGLSKTREPLYSTHPSPSFAWWYWQQSWCQNNSNKSYIINKSKISVERERVGKQRKMSNLTPSCLGLTSIGANPYMRISTFSALYTSWLLRIIIWTILLRKYQ